MDMINPMTENVDGQDLQTKENEYWVSMAESLERLEKNDDFKRVVLDGYFKDLAINQTSMLATDYVRKTGSRGEIFETLVGISALQDFFMTIRSIGTMAPEDDEE